MKYGYNDMDWDKRETFSKFADAVRTFNWDGYLSFMKRKTITKEEIEMLNALTEMVEIMNDHAKNLTVKK